MSVMMSDILQHFTACQGKSAWFDSVWGTEELRDCGDSVPMPSQMEKEWSIYSWLQWGGGICCGY